MGELALKQIQAGLEGAATRGTVAAPTRKLYGTMTMTRGQDRRYAQEERGNFIKYYRANPKLVEAGFSLAADETFEDLPYMCEMFMQGGITPTGAAGTGFKWDYTPDLTSDLIRTRTLYAGDDAVQWRGAFGVADTMDVTHDLNDAVHFTLAGWVQDWVPVTSAFLATGFSGGFAALSERTVESFMGYQARLFVDTSGGTIGTTLVPGKFISSRLGYHLNNDRKPFGDNVPWLLQKLGRGERDVTAQITFEGSNQAEFADHYNNVAKMVRIQFIGSAIAGTTFGVTSGAITGGTTVTNIVTTALTAAIPGGSAISIGGQTFSVGPAGAAAAATAIPVASQYVQNTIASGSTVMAAKCINHDFWGYWNNFVLGSRNTNTTFQLTLTGVYDSTAGYDHRITVYNGLALAAGIT